MRLGRPAGRPHHRRQQRRGHAARRRLHSKDSVMNERRNTSTSCAAFGHAPNRSITTAASTGSQGVPGCPADARALSGAAVRRIVAGALAWAPNTATPSQCSASRVPKPRSGWLTSGDSPTVSAVPRRSSTCPFARSSAAPRVRPGTGRTKILAELKVAPPHPRGQDLSGKRLVDIAARGDVHDERLWMPVAALSGARATLPAWSARQSRSPSALLKILSDGHHLISDAWIDPLNDASDYGRSLSRG